MKSIMYHYVRPFDPAYPHFKNLHIDDFRKQLDFFEKNYGFLSKNEFMDCLQSGVPKKGVILTFDDGLYCHYDFVFKELEKRGLWGIFYIPTQPYVEFKMLDVHRVHILLGKFESKQVFTSLNELIDNSLLDKRKLKEFKELTYTTQINDEYSLIVKRILNYFISYEHREKILNDLMSVFFPNENEILKGYYLSKEQIIEMHQKGMVIGSHTINHPVMSRLNYDDQIIQIEESFNFLENVVKEFRHKTFCYPYGGFHSFNNDTVDILNKNKCAYSFNVEQRDIGIRDLVEFKQSLPRYDCNQFKYGQVRTN